MKHLSSLVLLPLAGILTAGAAVTDNLVAYWGFEGSSANNAIATGGSAYDGALMGNAAVTGGAVKVGAGSLLLDGTGDYLDVGTIVDPNQPWSVSAWYRPTVAPAGTTRFMVFETSGSFPISFGLREGTNVANTNHQSFADVVPGTDATGNQDIADTATAGTWHHVVMAFTPATADAAGSVLVSIDGTVTNTLAVPAGNTLGTANGFHIGTYRAADGRWFNGSIDEVALWNRTLSADEMTEVFNRGNQGETLTSTKYSVALLATPATGGTVTGSGLYNAGQQVPVTATPNPGYIFSGWEGSFTGQPAAFTYTVNAGVTASALFDEDTADDDGDRLTNYEEVVIYHTLPNNPDTDGDLIPDGDELEKTSTDPTVSDAALVSFVRRNLAANQAGAIALSPLRIERNPATGAISLFLSLSGSADGSVWQDIDLGSPSVSITPAGDGWDITFPAPSNTVNSYIVTDGKP